MGEAQKNVYELAQERLHIIFKEFDNICVSFSGGKDSGVLLNLCIDYLSRIKENTHFTFIEFYFSLAIS